MKAETFYEGDNPLSYADEIHSIPAMMEREKKVQDEADEKCNKVETDFEGLPLFNVSRNSIIVFVNFHTEESTVFCTSFLILNMLDVVIPLSVNVYSGCNWHSEMSWVW